MQTTGDVERATRPEETEPPHAGVVGQRRRHGWRWWSGIIAVLLAMVLAGVWWSDYQATSNVIAATGIPDCQGTTTKPFEFTQGSGFRQTAILMNKGFVCTITVEVWNHSGSTVTLGQATVPLGGVHAGPGYEVTTIGSKAVPSDLPGSDAIVDLNEPIGPGQSQYIEYRVVYRTVNCDSARVTGGPIPTITVSRQLVSHTLVITDFPLFQSTHTSTTCPVAP